MTTPFDEAIDYIKTVRYHNQRKENHSDTVSKGVYRDLLGICRPLRDDVHAGLVRAWYNVRAPGGRKRKADLFIGEATASGKPDIQKLRIALENKSVVTAHRNRTNRYSDLNDTMEAIYHVRSEAVMVATVLVGLAQRVLNVPDRVHINYRGRESEFVSNVQPRLSSGDQTLWDEFPLAISVNRPNDPHTTVQRLRGLPTRPTGHTHVMGYDFVLLVPVFIDNVNPPSLPRPNALGIDVDHDYKKMLEQMCAAYTARWHM